MRTTGNPRSNGINGIMRKRLLTATCLITGTILVLAPESHSAQFFFDDEPRGSKVEVDGSEFVFARLIYRASRTRFGGGGCGNWRTDWPDADAHFMLGVERLSNIRILLDEYVSVDIMEPALFDYPLVYAVEVGCVDFSETEAARLREYMDRGGFLVVDDFWGTRQWDNFRRQVQKLFPDREIEDIPCCSHQVFHSFYDIDDILQVPVVNSACYGRQTWEQDGYDPYALAVFDDDRRPMLLINLNTDLGDAWEHADEPCYPHKYSGFAYRMGINFIVYAMTH
jgi:hypothetical protein